MAMTMPANMGAKGPVKNWRRVIATLGWFNASRERRRRDRQTSPKTVSPMPKKNRKSPNDTIAALNRLALCYHPLRARSSRAEQTTHNRWVDGSNPSGPTTLDGSTIRPLRRSLYGAYALFDLLEFGVVLVRQLVAAVKVELSQVAAGA